MQKKTIIPEQMEELLELSRDEEHPYFYRFSYTPSKGFSAVRIKKDSLNISSERRTFHNTEIDYKSSLGKAIKRIDDAKNVIKEFAYG